jgi:Ser/Thr protein kinase RdoA (MazF antagonist)
MERQPAAEGGRDGLGVTWTVRSAAFGRWLDAPPAPVRRPLGAGFEAEIEALARPGAGGAPAFVLKRWRPGWAVDPGAQHAFLEHAARVGLPVAAPAGWGRTDDGRPVLATAYAGAPVATPSDEHLRRCAGVLRRIHATPLAAVGMETGVETGAAPAGGDEILGASFPRLRSEPDLRAICHALRQRIAALPPALVHGDFNQGNILLRRGALSVVDWTEAGAGDPRLDLAWAWIGLWIYGGAGAAATFRERYLAGRPRGIDRAALGDVEALAGLRWLLIRRRLLRRGRTLSPGGTSVGAIAALVDARLPPAWQNRLPELSAG